MDFLPIVVQADYCGGFTLRLVFNDGTAKTMDFGPWLVGPVFERLKDVEYFRRFFLEGGTVTWPNGADIAPETLHQRAKASEAA